MTDKMELTKHHKLRYGSSPYPSEPRPERCADYASMGSFYQCTHKRHPDTMDGAFCKQHCPNRRKAKREARQAKWQAEAAAAQAERQKAARQAELKDEAVRLLTDIAGRAATNSWAVFDAQNWLRKWRAAQ